MYYNVIGHSFKNRILCYRLILKRDVFFGGDKGVLIDTHAGDFGEL